MNISEFNRQPQAGVVILILGLMGATGAYNCITGQYGSSADPWGLFGGKLLYGFLGAVVGIVVGIIVAIALTYWRLDSDHRKQLLRFFLAIALAPIAWVFFDFSEFSTTTAGAIMFWTLNVVAVGWLVVRYRKPIPRFIGILTAAIIWQILVGWWFIAITWQHIDYWD